MYLAKEAFQEVLLHEKCEESAQNVTRTENKMGMFEFKAKIVWFNALGFLAMHLIGLYGIAWGFHKVLFQYDVASVIWTGILIFFSGEGILMGAHRFWSHKTFKATLPLELILIAFQTLAGQNCLYIWARDHRQHHKFSDTDADPHNASRGFFFSHIGWLMMKKHPDVIKMGQTIDLSDLEANPIVMFQKKYYKPLYTLIALILPVGIPIYLWNEDPVYSFVMNFFTRYIFLLNLTWSVNSFAHLYGYKPYDKNILPVESTFVSFITIGEGWHNYHHAFPWDYKCAELFTGLNFTRSLIEFFEKIGWAYDLRKASDAVVEAKAKRSGDGSYIANKPAFKIGDDDDVDIVQRRITLNHG